MSVIAGCSLFDGLLIGSDCRVTITKPGKPEIYTDNCQKLYAIADTSVIGFVGDLRPASQILQAMFIQLPHKRQDGASLLGWLPRLFRHEYAKSGATQPIAFMVASCLLGRLNVVEREAVVRLMNQFIAKKRTWGPAILAQLLMVPPQCSQIAIPGTCCGLLYTMHAPDFQPRLYRPLQFVAIGSGRCLEEDIEEKQDMIFACDPGNYHMEGIWFREAIQRFLKRKNVPSVGGLFPVMKVDRNGVLCLGQRTRSTPSGLHVELIPADDGWIQTNCVTGKQIKLVNPWEVDAQLSSSRTVDDLRKGPFG